MIGFVFGLGFAIWSILCVREGTSNRRAITCNNQPAPPRRRPAVTDTPFIGRERTANRRASTYNNQPALPRRPAVRESTPREVLTDTPFIGRERTAYSSVGEKCTICYEAMDIPSMVVLKCSHGLHIDCYNTLIQYSKKCPECKRDMVVRVSNSPH